MRASVRTMDGYDVFDSGFGFDYGASPLKRGIDFCTD